MGQRPRESAASGMEALPSVPPLPLVQIQGLGSGEAARASLIRLQGPFPDAAGVLELTCLLAHT